MQSTLVDVSTEQKMLPVFNLEVASAHTFFIGEEGALVHNGDCFDKVGKYKILKKTEVHNGAKLRK